MLFEHGKGWLSVAPTSHDRQPVLADGHVGAYLSPQKDHEPDISAVRPLGFLIQQGESMKQATSKIKMYNWNTLPREVVRKGVERVGYRSENAMVVMNFAEPGMDVRPHSHDFEQVAICVQGRMNYYVGDEVFEMVPGSMLRIPAHTIHYAEPLGDEVVLNLDLFSPIRDDYKHLVAYQAEEFTSEPIDDTASTVKEVP